MSAHPHESTDLIDTAAHRPAERPSDPTDLRGRLVLGVDGERLGPIQELFADAPDGDPAWATVASDRDGAVHLLPLAGARHEGEDVHVPYLGDTIRGSVLVRDVAVIDHALFAQLREHYAAPVAPDELPVPAPERVVVVTGADEVVRIEEVGSSSVDRLVDPLIVRVETERPVALEVAAPDARRS